MHSDMFNFFFLFVAEFNLLGIIHWIVNVYSYTMKQLRASVSHDALHTGEKYDKKIIIEFVYLKDVHNIIDEWCALSNAHV